MACRREKVKENFTRTGARLQKRATSWLLWF